MDRRGFAGGERDSGQQGARKRCTEAETYSIPAIMRLHDERNTGVS